jgi:putative addiction module component (TIGR02574 family)
MTRRAKELLAEAMKLPREDRALLGVELLDSIHDDAPDDVEAEWRDEILRRIETVESGETRLHPWSDVYERLRARLTPR